MITIIAFNLGLRSVSERIGANARQLRVCKMNAIQRVSTDLDAVFPGERPAGEG
jgi:hypothetical protein